MITARRPRPFQAYLFMMGLIVLPAPMWQALSLRRPVRGADPKRPPMVPSRGLNRGGRQNPYQVHAGLAPLAGFPFFLFLTNVPARAAYPLHHGVYCLMIEMPTMATHCGTTVLYWMITALRLGVVTGTLRMYLTIMTTRVILIRAWIYTRPYRMSFFLDSEFSSLRIDIWLQEPYVAGWVAFPSLEIITAQHPL